MLINYNSHSYEGACHSCSRNSNRSWIIIVVLQLNGGFLMKIVVVKSPKLLTPFLRFFFKIKKENT